VGVIGVQMVSQPVRLLVMRSAELLGPMLELRYNPRPIHTVDATQLSS